MVDKLVYDFHEGNMDMKDLLGGKGANLAEMTHLGLPVPPGFTITTDVCRSYLRSNRLPDELNQQVDDALLRVEENIGRKLGDHEDPLLVSVRSGAKFSMPGMMETVLNVGLNDYSVDGLARTSGDPRFAWDSYRRLIQMFGKTVLGIDADLFADKLEEKKESNGYKSDTELTVADLQDLVEDFKQIVKTQTGKEFPQGPREQMFEAIEAVFKSWNTERAVIYRRREKIPDDLGTAVNIVAMVFGNMGQTSGTGVCFTRDPATGHRGVYGDYLSNAQGEDVVAGIRNTETLADLEKRDLKSYQQLRDIMTRLEMHYKDLCDIEFTIEKSRLWILQTRVGKRTAAAAFRVACQLVDEGIIGEREALERVTGAQLTQLMFPQISASATKELLATATPASPGAASGKIAFNNEQAKKYQNEGIDCVLVRHETNPDDLAGMVAAQGILTARGGKTSHAAVVARGMGKTCVVGADQLLIDEEKQTVTVNGRILTANDTITIDGASGEIFYGDTPVEDSVVTQLLRNGLEDTVAKHKDSQDDVELITSVDRILQWADKYRTLKVRANADTPLDSARSIEFGAQGIGLCRTEHMFLGERRQIVEAAILSEEGSKERLEAFAKLSELQKQDYLEILEVMDGLPVTVRLIDPPLHEFLPDLVSLEVKASQSETQNDGEFEKLLQAVRRLHEQNPMLGLRGVRLGLVLDGLFGLQVRALVEATIELKQKGLNPKPEIMIPLVGEARELQIVREEIEQIIATLESEANLKLDIPIGCMIELPRAAITAGSLAQSADFFSFGTNDLTQMTWGFSRDDVEGSFFPQYMEKGIFNVSPFETIDRVGVGALVQEGVKRGKETNPEIKLGVCGEHGGDPDSVHFFHQVGLNYVSCSPFRIPVARLEAGRAAVLYA